MTEAKIGSQDNAGKMTTYIRQVIKKQGISQHKAKDRIRTIVSLQGTTNRRSNGHSTLNELDTKELGKLQKTSYTTITLYQRNKEIEINLKDKSMDGI